MTKPKCCIECGQSYETNEIGPYVCDDCLDNEHVEDLAPDYDGEYEGEL